MRLLMTADTVGGVWDYALMLCADLARHHDVQTLLVSMGPAPSEEQCRAAAAVPGLDLYPTTYALEWMPDSLPDVLAAGELIGRLVAEYRPRAVHFNQHCFGSLDLGVPAVVVSHSDSLSWQYYQWGAVDPHPGWAAYGDLVRAGLRGACAVVAPTEFVAGALRTLYVPDLAVRVIPNGAALAPGVVPRAVGAPRRVAAMGAGRVWDSAKNLMVLARAAALLPATPGYRVEIAGNREAPHGARAEMASPANVAFLGQVPRAVLHERLTDTRLFVAPARYEPFGLGLVEAALAGCALLVADIPSFREVWGGDAVYVAGADPADWAAALMALLEDDPRRQQLAEAGRSRALCRYTTARMATAYAALYRELGR
jgi:glycosyltransferase involved in cell wall biosynthesis